MSSRIRSLRMNCAYGRDAALLPFRKCSSRPGVTARFEFGCALPDSLILVYPLAEIFLEVVMDKKEKNL
jgi:hypothetical protein